jgi:hypothetical protein
LLFTSILPLRSLMMPLSATSVHASASSQPHFRVMVPRSPSPMAGDIDQKVPDYLVDL